MACGLPLLDPGDDLDHLPEALPGHALEVPRQEHVHQMLEDVGNVVGKLLDVAVLGERLAADQGRVAGCERLELGAFAVPVLGVREAIGQLAEPGVRAGSAARSAARSARRRSDSCDRS
jgi:hypothetical protein